MVRAIRGATTVKENSEKEILEATRELLKKMAEQNGIEESDIISIIFSVTPDLNAAFPAAAARQLGWNKVALMCTNEIGVPGSLEKCIRIMMHFNTSLGNEELKYVYLRNAGKLRTDIANQGTCMEE